MLSFLVERAPTCCWISGGVGCKEVLGERSELREGERKGDVQGSKVVKEAMVVRPAGRGRKFLLIITLQAAMGLGWKKGPQ